MVKNPLKNLVDYVFRNKCFTWWTSIGIRFGLLGLSDVLLNVSGESSNEAGGGNEVDLRLVLRRGVQPGESVSFKIMRTRYVGYGEIKSSKRACLAFSLLALCT